MKKLTLFILTLLSCFASEAKLRVVATLPDLAGLAKLVGGDDIEVISLCRKGEDPHFVDPKPSYVSVLNKADLLIENGAEMEIGWLPPLVNGARNKKILQGATGRLNAAHEVRMLEIPLGPVDRSQGDIHASGNPHYLLDPRNGVIVAKTISLKLQELDSKNATAYQQRFESFRSLLDKKTGEWKERMSFLKGIKVVSYHKTYSYLLDFLEVELLATIESKPGI
jgi:zinc/manganese transport system substrate-binding protein